MRSAGIAHEITQAMDGLDQFDLKRSVDFMPQMTYSDVNIGAFSREARCAVHGGSMESFTV